MEANDSQFGCTLYGFGGGNENIIIYQNDKFLFLIIIILDILVLVRYLIFTPKPLVFMPMYFFFSSTVLITYVVGSP